MPSYNEGSEIALSNKKGKSADFDLTFRGTFCELSNYLQGIINYCTFLMTKSMNFSRRVLL